MSRTSSLLLAVAATAAALCFCGVDGAASPASTGAGVDAVADSCGAIRDFVDAGFCASRLGSVPGAASADRHAHLLAAANLAAASGVAAQDAAAGTARDDLNPAARDALEACVILYGSGSVPALRLLRGYAAARSWGAARALLPLTGQAGIGCEAALGRAPGAGAMAAPRTRAGDAAHHHDHRAAQQRQLA